MKKIKIFLAKYEWWILGLLALSSFIGGVIGFDIHFRSTGRILSLLDLMYLALQLFTFESGSVHGYVPVILEISRFLAPLLLTFAAIKTFLTIASERIKMFKLKTMKNHIIICSLNERSIRLTRDLINLHKKIVIIEENADNPEIEALKNNGVFVLIGNLTDVTLLEKANVAKAKYLICFSTNDSVNISIALSAYNWIREHKIYSSCVSFIGVSDIRMLSKLKDLDFFIDVERNKISDTEQIQKYEIRTFNIYERAARLIFNRFSPDIFSRIHTEQDEQAHVLIVGFNQLCEGLIFQFARTGHYANFKKTKISLLVENANQINKFIKEYSNLRTLIDLNTVTSDYEHFNLNTLSELETPIKITTIYICIDDEQECLSFIHHIKSLLSDSNKNMVICLSSGKSIINLIPESQEKNKMQVFKFPILEETCTYDSIINETIDEMAKVIHSDYLDKLGENRNPARESHKEWDLLSDEMKNQNRNQAEHIFIKLRAINCVTKPIGTSESKYEIEKDSIAIEKLAKMEHNRWSSEMIFNGWIYGSGRDNKKKTNPDLVPYEKLPEDIKQLDRNVVINIPNLLKKMKLEICKLEK
ncbi:MAG: NAD-binding protein [Ignavibacteriales bacterium]|nr:NAD-binding protein [Ignavibacteriales bacterium]